MASLRQIEANRRNSQNSTGPRTEQGKASSRFNALKTGIHAQSQVIPGENAADLERLAAEYHVQFQPSTPVERDLVDLLVASQWQIRRLRKVEAQLWQHEINDATKTAFGSGLQQDCPLGHVFDRAHDNFSRMNRCVQAAERSYFRTLKELNRLQADSGAAAAHSPGPAAVPRPLAPGSSPAPDLPPVTQIGFVPSLPPEPALRMPPGLD